MESVKLTYNDVVLYLTLINILLGFLFGIFPLISGIIMKNRKFGVYGFIGSVIGGAILGVFLSFPIALIFTWLILKKSFPNQPDGTIATDDILAESEVKSPENR